MATKDKMAKLVAIFALFWIIIWIIGTWLLILLNWWQQSTSSDKNLSAEQYKQIQDMIKANWGTWVLINSWVTDTKVSVTWSSDSTWNLVWTWSVK